MAMKNVKLLIDPTTTQEFLRRGGCQHGYLWFHPIGSGYNQVPPGNHRDQLIRLTQANCFCTMALRVRPYLKCKEGGGPFEVVLSENPRVDRRRFGASRPEVGVKLMRVYGFFVNEMFLHSGQSELLRAIVRDVVSIPRRGVGMERREVENPPFPQVLMRPVLEDHPCGGGRALVIAQHLM